MTFWFPGVDLIIKHMLPYSNSEICFHKLTCIFHKRLFIPYLPQVGGDHRRKGIWFGWMGVFHCPVRPSSFPHLLPTLPAYSPLLKPSSSLSTHPTLRPPYRAKAMRLSIHARLTLPVLIEHLHIHTCLFPLFLVSKHSSVLSVSHLKDYLGLRCLSWCHTTSIAKKYILSKIVLSW